MATRSMTRAYERAFEANIQKSDDPLGCWLWTGPSYGRGYGGLGQGEDRVYAHRLAWEIADDETIPVGLIVGHTCDARRCVRNDEEGTYEVRGVILPRWGHLFLGTPANNSADRDDKGRGTLKKGVPCPWKTRTTQGSARPDAKLTETGARDIIARYSSGGATQRALAAEYGIHQSIVSCIVNGKRWAHVRGPRP